MTRDLDPQYAVAYARIIEGAPATHDASVEYLQEQLAPARLQAYKHMCSGPTNVLYSDGFRWHQDELEDFVAFYMTGRHRSDDLLGRMERDYMRKRWLRFSRAVHGFAWMCRPQREIRPTEINWNVQPPEDSAFASE